MRIQQGRRSCSSWKLLKVRGPGCDSRIACRRKRKYLSPGQVGCETVSIDENIHITYVRRSLQICAMEVLCGTDDPPQLNDAMTKSRAEPNTNFISKTSSKEFPR
jgi:hypothetical protein